MPVAIQSTSQVFSALGGLPIFDQIIQSIGMKHTLKSCLPQNKITPQVTSFQKFRALLYGFIAGADCLDDMDDLTSDLAFESVAKSSIDARTYGNYLRSFDMRQWRKLNGALTDIALKLRYAAAKNVTDFILDCDSTHHEQTAKKMEGLNYDYDSHWGLTSLQAFDQFGFQHWMEVREGNAATATGASSVITDVFGKVPKRLRRLFRADSGFCNANVFNACHSVNAKFVIAMRANMYEPLLGSIRHWYKNENIRFRDGRIAHVGTALYHPERTREVCRVLVMRAYKTGPRAMFDDPYDYIAFITNISHGEMKDEAIVDFYRQRGNAENFIKELKGGYDIRHFPCQKLIANRVYGVIAAFAHNLMRYASFILASGKMRYTKMLRFRMVHLACQVVRKARGVAFRFHHLHAKEVLRWIVTIKHQQYLSG